MVKTNISNTVILALPSDETHTNDGGELQFYGRVRDIENDQPIVALDYEYYEGMAEKELQKLGEETMSRFAINQLDCIHRVGKIPVGEASLRVVIWSKHRVEGLDAMAWFISQMKKDVPIWKNAILEDGSRIPSMCNQC
ncbi:MAG: molybdenum cofactor biosynthesis protein MoaE [Candidatus Marinimicrobia bacterium]|jgi:molybdopterin synthase catalytic subunit|nr:molybdenum cofactor biosynthesis protein MoaE [Candidatus Neomarinimicrobiota bacterium]MBT6871483.1 molybdenum cofactor biosynthesis protein MoaE [Candidatus Neomarinimicrobiota bacterium]MBT7376870.1 molybdenum cofactor biosynthesis protein MoaE [Candidatus Neomarinimicrobiota bacterium]